MFDDFMVRAAFAGVGVAIAAAPLGCFVVWRRMAYFGDSTAHFAMLGIALSLTFEFSIFAGAILLSLMLASLITFTGGRSFYTDTLLGVVGHISLAAGLVIVSLISGIRIDLLGYLIGDILAVSVTDLYLIWIGAAIVATLIVLRWSPLLLVTLSEDLASANGLQPKKEGFLLTIALAIVVAVGIKVVGVLLIVSMLIIPAAAARSFSSTPEGMGIAATMIGIISAILGLYSAYTFDTPTGPSIVCMAAICFVISLIIGIFSNRMKN